MTSRSTALAALLVCIVGCGAPQPDPPKGAATQAPWGSVSSNSAGLAEPAPIETAVIRAAFAQALRPGVDLHFIPGGPTGELIALGIDLAHFEPVLATNRDGISAEQAIAELKLTAVVGSSFVSAVNSMTPVGLLQVEGQERQRLQPHGYTRVLGLRHDAVGVIGTRDYHGGMFDSAVQVGPGIVESGALDILERDLEREPYFRAFVATCAETVLIGASTAPTHLYTLGQQLLAYAASAELACDEVVNLAGDREAVLAAATPNGVVFLGHPRTAKAALIGFRARPRNNHE